MTGSPPSETDAESTAETPTDPDELRERPDVEICEHTFVHGSTDHCEADAAGRVIVGVTNADGAVLVLENEEAPYPMLPNEVVESGEDWGESARQAAEDAAGAPVELGDPLRVRDVEHRVDGEDERQTETTHVVYRASLASDADDADPPFPADCDWTAHWLDEFPDAMVEEEASPVEDVRLLFR